MIYLFNPPPPHHIVFLELITTFRNVLHELLGLHSTEIKHCMTPDETNAQTEEELQRFRKNVYVLFGAHIPKYPFNMKLNYFVFNYEQANSPYMKWPAYLACVRHSLAILDYSPENLELWFMPGVPSTPGPLLPTDVPSMTNNTINQTQFTISKSLIAELPTTEVRKPMTFLIPFGFHKSLEHPHLLMAAEMPVSMKKTDVLLFGTAHPRRSGCIDRLKAVNINAKMISNTFGDALIDELRHTKLVLNIHFYLPCVLEQSRLAPLICNQIVVISEPTNDPTILALYKDCVVFCEETDLVRTCFRFLLDDKLRIDFAKKARETFELRCSYVDLVSRSAVTTALRPFACT